MRLENHWFFISMKKGKRILRQHSEYKCSECEHDFNRFPWTEEKIRCPRCGSDEVEHNPYLLGTCSADLLTSEDYFAVALKP